MIATEIRDKDKPALQKLKLIEYKKFENSDDYEISFTFEPNDFFENTKLTKKFFFHEDDD